MQFEAPIYPEEGIENFKRDMIYNEEFIQNCKNEICPLYIAFDGDNMVGVGAMRKNRTHISLLFVKQEYQRNGIASELVRALINDSKAHIEELSEITVNASPYGLPFYYKIGFKPLDDEQLTNGIRYTPMKLRIVE